SISDKSAAIAYEVLDEWDDRVRTSASSVAFTDSSIRGVIIGVGGSRDTIWEDV
nr:hypothetical protein [Tanacetum cinerariifolium]